MVKVYGVLFLLVLPMCFLAQDVNQPADTSDFREVVITATRSEQKSKRVPVPVSTITAKEIKAAGFMRLDQVLGELNGAAVINNFGNGIQLRGLDPAYTLILVDSEPVIGRNGGTYDLGKLPVGNIERIEVVRGPVSALYGSEALAGVINIITKKPPPGTSKELRLGYGSNQTYNVSGSLGFNSGKFSGQLFADGYRTNGFDLDKATLYKSGSENRNGTLQGKMHYRFNDRWIATLNSRYYEELVTNRDRFEVDKVSQEFDMADRTREGSFSPSLKFYLNKRTTFSFNQHLTLYDYHSKVNYSSNGSNYLDDQFRQILYKPEVLVDTRINDRYIVTGGGGYIGEGIITNRYAENQYQSTAFAFLQGQATIAKKFTAIAGGRLDNSSVYNTYFSPKVSLQYRASDRMRWYASWGNGFKAPDYRQLYLNFSNALIGYSVFGSEELLPELQSLMAAGVVESILVDESRLGKLRPENSTALDATVEVRPTNRSSIAINVFRNDISDLIETLPVAQKFNGQYIYSYLNLNNVYTRGLQVDASLEWKKNFTIGMGYMYLEAKDKQVERDIRNGEIYGRDPETLYSYPITLSQYGGLFNRSRHSGNVRVLYHNIRFKWDASVRYIYRGRFGFGDKNGNQILDADNEYVDGYGLLNVSLTRELNPRCAVQLSCTNALDYTNAEYIPSLSGRTFLLSAQFNLNKQTHNTPDNENKK